MTDSTAINLTTPKQSLLDISVLIQNHRESTNDTNINAFNKLCAFNKANPNTKKLYRQMQSWKLKNNLADDVFYPMSEMMDNLAPIEKLFWLNPANHGLPENEIDARFTNFVWQLHTFGAWRNTLGIYRIDPDLYEQAISSPIPKETPTSIFSRLPEWCVYLQLPVENAIPTFNNGIASLVVGFWTLFDIEYIDDIKRKVLHIFFDTVQLENTPFQLIPPIRLIIEEGVSVEESFLKDYTPIDGIDETEQAVLRNQTIKQNMGLLSLLLMLCAEEPDISNINGESVTSEQMRMPKYGRHKKTGAFVPPSQPKVYDIGKRLGGEVRQFNKEYGQTDSRISSRKRPHIRRGHWHGVWKGTGQDKQFSIYWQPAIFVNTRI